MHSGSQICSALLLVTTVSAMTVEYNSSSSAPDTRPLDPTIKHQAGSCSRVGNTDLYGLGIRLGVYLQLFSTLIANHFLPETAQEAWDSNAVFIVAIFIAILKSSATKNGFAPFEAFVMLQMLLAFLLAVFSVAGSLWLLFDLCVRALSGDFFLTTAKSSVILTELSLSRSTRSQLGTNARSLLTVWIAGYQCWYWFGGAKQLGANSKCDVFVFLFTRVGIQSRAAVVFKIFAVLFLVQTGTQFLMQSPIADFTSNMFTWWLLRPLQRKGQRQRVYYEKKPTFKEALINAVNPRPRYETDDSDVEVQDIRKKWKPKKWDRRSHARRTHILVVWWHTITFSCSLSVILWSITAIETTLVWNGVLQIYSVSSTGQLIPLIVGVAGSIRIAFQFLAHRRPKLERISSSDINFDKISATWRYRMPDKRTAVFAVNRPVRRRSFDTVEVRREGSIHISVGSEDVREPQDVPLESKYDRIAPCLPVLKRDADARAEEFYYGRQIYAKWSTARWMYKAKAGGTHIIHDMSGYMRRRASFDGVPELASSGFPLPHKARPHAQVPLRMKSSKERNEKDRLAWYNEQLTVESKRWLNRPVDDVDNYPSDSEENPSVLPAMLDDMSAFSQAGLNQDESSRPNTPRRWSADDESYAYENFGDRPYPFFDKDASSVAISDISHYATSTDGTTSASVARYVGSDASTYSHSISSSEESRRWKSKSTTYRMFLLLLACAPCAMIATSLRRRRRKRRFGPLTQVDKISNGLRSATSEVPARCMRCPECDEDLEDLAETRTARNLKSGKLEGIIRTTMSSKYLKAFYSSLFLSPRRMALRFARRSSSWEKIESWWTYEMRPGIQARREYSKIRRRRQEETDRNRQRWSRDVEARGSYTNETQQKGWKLFRNRNKHEPPPPVSVSRANTEDFGVVRTHESAREFR